MSATSEPKSNVHTGPPNSRNKITKKDKNAKNAKKNAQTLGDLEVYRDVDKLYSDIVNQAHLLKTHLSKYFSPEKDPEFSDLLQSLDKLIVDLQQIASLAPQFDFADVPANGYRSLLRIWLNFLKIACKINSELKLRNYVTALVSHLSAWPGLLVETASTSMSNNNNYDALVGRQHIIYFYSTFNKFVHEQLIRPKLLLKMFHPTFLPFAMMFLRVAVYCFEPSFKKKIIKQHYLTYDNTLKSLLKQLVALKPEYSANWIRSANWALTQSLVKAANTIERPLGYAGVNFTKRKVKINCPNRFMIRVTETKVTLEDNRENVSSFIGDETSAFPRNEEEDGKKWPKRQPNCTLNKVFILKSFSTKIVTVKDKGQFNCTQSSLKNDPIQCNLSQEVPVDTSHSNNNFNSNLNNGSAGGKNTSDNSNNNNCNGNNKGMKTSGLIKSKSRMCAFYSKLNANEVGQVVKSENNNCHPGEKNNIRSSEKETSGPFNLSETYSATGKVLLYIHGGAFLGPKSSSLIEIFLRDWSSKLPGITFLVPEYSYAPESTFPTAWQEVLNFYIWLVTAPRAEVSKKLGISVDPSKLVLAGDSSGGLLSSSLLVMLNEINTSFNLNIPVPREVVLLFPKCSMRVEIVPSALISNYDLLLNGFVLLSVAEAVLPITIKDESTGKVKLITQEERRNLPGDWFKNLNYQVLDSPILSPLTYEKMDHLKDINLNLLVVTFDPLLDDGVLFARKWKGKVNFYVADDVCHGAFYYRQFAPCANQFNHQVLTTLKNALDSL